MPLHPKEYVRHVLRDLKWFFEGEVDYPEINLKLAGEEAWLDAYPNLRGAVHEIARTIREFAHEYNLDDFEEYYDDPLLYRQILNEIKEAIQPEVRELIDYLSRYYSREDVLKAYGDLLTNKGREELVI